MEITQTQKQWYDRIIWILLVSLVILTASELVGEYLLPQVDSQSAYLYTFNQYASFITIWLGVLLTMVLFKGNRFMLASVTSKSPGNTWQNLLIGLVVGFGLNGLCALVAWLNGDFKLVLAQFEFWPAMGLLVAVFIQSSAEEVLCRGFLYQRLWRATGKVSWVIVINSLFFAVLHLFNDGINWLAFYDLFITGIFFSMVVYYYDSLWMAMGLHTAWNYTQSILLGLPNSGTSFPYSIFKLADHPVKASFAYDVDFGLEGTILAASLMTLCCVVLYYVHSHRKKSTEVEI